MALKEKIIDKAQKFIQKGYIDKAIVEYKAALDIDPKDVAVRLRLGELYVKVNKTSDAIREYTEAAKANTQRGFYLKAIAVYKQILKLDDNLEVHYKLADLYTKQRLMADALSEYSFIVSLFEKKGKTNEVLELLKKMIDIDPDNIGIRLRLAELYHKLAFDKDALAEYSIIFTKLMELGKLDKAEKVFLGLYNTYPGEPTVLKGLSELYARKGDTGLFYRYASPLFRVYRDSGDTEAARGLSGEILRVKPGDADCLKFIERFNLRGTDASAAPESSPSDEVSGVQPESWTEERAPQGKEAEVAASMPEEKPEEEIEITVEGFEDAGSEAAVSAAEAFKEEASEASGSEEIGAEPEAEVEIELPGVDEHQVVTGPEAEAVPEPAPAEDAAEEIWAEAEPEEEATIEEASAPVSEPEVVFAQVEEAVEEISAEAQPETPVTIEETPAPSQAMESRPVEEEFSEGSLEEALEEAIEVVNLKISEAGEDEPAQTPQPEQFPEEEEIPSIAAEEMTEGTGIIETAAEEAAPEVQEEIAQPVADVEAEPAPEPEPELDIPADADGSVETAAETQSTPLIEKITPDDMLVEPEKLNMEVAPEAGKGEDYVDLSAELGMEETIKDMAGSWGGGDSKEAYDEFKNGIGQQLSKEDTETHYNLGIAYMEMELYSEASKEFKIALKDPHLEFDCLIRLGLSSMAEGEAREAIGYYLRGLKVEGRSTTERMGMMYELALAYESAGDMDDAGRLFNSIYDADPGYREVAGKVSFAAPRSEVPLIPLDDGLIEVEIL